MKQCPIAHWKQLQPDTLAFSSLNYAQFDQLIQRYCFAIQHIPQQTIAFVPKPTVKDIAFCFAIWRCKKTLFPLSHRLPQKALEKRIHLANAAWVELNQLILSSSLSIDTIDEKAIATLLETSSSSKIVCHTLENHFVSAVACAKALDLRQEDSYCLNLPLFHISGLALILRTFLKGAKILFPDENPLATHISMVPTQLYRQIHHPEPFPNLKCLLVGGAPLSESLRRQALKVDLPIYTTYGMTEVGSMAVIKKGNQKAIPLEHIDLQIGEDREILLQSPSLMTGYFGQVKHKGLFHTRDLGKYDASKGLQIIGRKDRQFISGGENIQPEEVENALLAIPHIIQAKVVPMEDPEYGMRPTAEIFCERDLSSIEIQNQLEEVLPRYKIPSKIIFQRDLNQFMKIPEH